MATSNGPDLSPIRASPPPRHQRSNSGAYYEDVDPRFASDPEPVPSMSHAESDRQSGLPNSLLPGGQGQVMHRASPQPLAIADGNIGGARGLERDESYENIAEGARSPAGSDASHFTSVSQRGVNPNWRPGPPAGLAGSQLGNGVATQRRNERNDMILGANPDFSIPGMGAPRGGPSAAFRGRGGPMGMRPGAGPAGLTPQGRYPTDV